MDDKKFLELLKLCSKEKRVEGETPPEILVENKPSKAHTGKTFWQKWLEI